MNSASSKSYGTGDLILGAAHTSSDPKNVPNEVEEGESCLDAIKAFKAAGCTKSDLIDISGVQPLAGNSRTGSVSKGDHVIRVIVEMALNCPDFS